MATRAQWARRPGRSSKWITKLQRLAIYFRDGFRCLYCEVDLSAASPRELTLDHYRPRSKGGSHKPTNVFTACAVCNFVRQDRPVHTYATPEAKRRIQRHLRRKPHRSLARAVLSGSAVFGGGTVRLNITKEV